MAPRIELRTGVLIRGVQRDELVADKIVSCSDAFGNRVSDGAAGLHERRCAPAVGCAVAAVLLDFEPDGTARGKVSATFVWGMEDMAYEDSGIQLLQPESGHLAM